MKTLKSLHWKVDLSWKLVASLMDRAKNAKDPESALTAAEIAANLAWMCHSGAFRLSPVEETLKRKDLANPFFHFPGDLDLKGRTLHVLTTAFQTGGHTRLARRWMEMAEEPCALVLARQGQKSCPDWLKQAGEDIPFFDLDAMGVTAKRDKVAALIQLFKSADRVVFHIHPDDACAVAAAYATPGLNLLFLDHADHVAWLGSGLSAGFVHLRESAITLGRERRGIAPEAGRLLPILLLPKNPQPREEARRNLGIGADEVLLLTMATPYKYVPICGRSLDSMFDQLLAQHPSVRLAAIGPGPKHPVFGPLMQKYPGRVQSMGYLTAPGQWQAAADVYLDSYPFGSATSLLESLSLGTPVLSFQPQKESLGILFCELPALPFDAYAVCSKEQWLERLGRLVEDPGERAALSKRQAGGLAAHLPQEWRSRLAALTSCDLPGREPAILRENKEVDAMISGLGRSPFSYLRFKFWKKIPVLEWVRLMALHFMGWGQR